MITKLWFVISMGSLLLAGNCMEALSPPWPTNCETSKWLPSVEIDRRLAIEASAATLLTLLLGQSSDATEPQTIVITGSNSGVGFFASKLLAEKGHTIVMACRTKEKASDAAKRVRDDVSNGTLIPAVCDLSSLESIRNFAKGLAIDKIDVLCLNAGIALNTDDKTVQRTVDGFELTVGVNHLGHVYLNSLLLPKVNRNGGRIVITSSGVHDPETLGGKQGKTATLGDLQGFERDGSNFEMVDGGSYDGDKAYKDSKLCNVLFTRELQRRLKEDASTSDISVNCFSPGLVPTTGLFRNQNPLLSKAFAIVSQYVVSLAETPEWAGSSLAFMTSVRTKGEFWNSPPGSSKFGKEAFGREFTVFEPSKEAQDDAKAKRLWSLSEKLLNIPS